MRALLPTGARSELHHSTCAQLSLQARDGPALSVVASRQGSASSSMAAQPGSGSSHPWRFQVPTSRTLGLEGEVGGVGSMTTAGVVGAAPLGDAFVASAWVEGQQSAGQRGVGWGVGLHSQPDRGGQAVGVVLARPRSSPAAAVPLLCELSWRVPLTDGLELSPGALVVRAEGATATALQMAASWRF